MRHKTNTNCFPSPILSTVVHNLYRLFARKQTSMYAVEMTSPSSPQGRIDHRSATASRFSVLSSGMSGQVVDVSPRPVPPSSIIRPLMDTVWSGSIPIRVDVKSAGRRFSVQIILCARLRYVMCISETHNDTWMIPKALWSFMICFRNSVLWSTCTRIQRRL